jgi:predicted metal-dependent phosphoesterase TrpH
MELLKGELHFHTEASTLEEMVAGLGERGYGFCVVTDHNAVNAVFRPKGCQPVLVAGVEHSMDIQAGRVHVSSFPCGWAFPEPPPRVPYGIGEITRRDPRSAIVINHPLRGTHWTVKDVAMAAKLGAGFLEINPKGYDIRQATRLWDEALTKGTRILATLSSDAHGVDDLGSFGYVLVEADPNEASIMDAILAGRFCCVQEGCASRLVCHEVMSESRGGLIVVRAVGAVSVDFVGAGGKLLYRGHAQESTYRVVGDEPYVRPEVRDGGGRAIFLQPTFCNWRRKHPITPYCLDGR